MEGFTRLIKLSERANKTLGVGVEFKKVINTFDGCDKICKTCASIPCHKIDRVIFLKRDAMIFHMGVLDAVSPAPF